ncbi:sugar phosphate isomerase/epimerase family protein [Streptomyces sp. CB03911]|uniref:sugar phosphate isomerase/epimerase family protein n=1 Tax=Streptomyces sp. CB03911 TaxID=1804758 RepID=UPI00093C2219|nr:sugar phosphate isomerase/epimerase family protein [Streptomyces sp. CB03911]OKI12769.1 sugar phosphate isomerase [Streptomyces sp. CB03911]
MRLALSTLGTPGTPLADSVALARSFGLDGLELRLHPDTGVHAGLDATGRAAVVRTLGGLPAFCLSGYVRICEPGDDEPVIEALRADLRLARDLGAGHVRVFPGGEDLDAGARRLAAVADEGPRVLVETHDALPTGAAVAALLERAPHAGAIWDLLHPWRHGEEPAETLRLLGDRLACVQIKDAASATDTTPVPLGTGAVPLAAARRLLDGFDGWVSLEWERTWYPDVPPVEYVLPGALDWIAG